MREILRHFINEFGAGHELSSYDAAALFDAIIACKDALLLTQLLLAWNNKGITENEIVDLATIMRSRMQRIDSRGRAVVDIVGTGGSKAKSFNVSTAAAFVVGGAGVPVTKHGNKAATSNSGSSDVLDHLGVKSDVSPETAQQCLDEIGICFMFAPRFHSLSPTLAKVRRSLGVPTVFNWLGPLCNPASAPHQVIGVWAEDGIGQMARALARLGTTRSWVVHGENGLDEIALDCPTRVIEINSGSTTLKQISMAHFGTFNGHRPVPAKLDAHESAVLIRKILENKKRGSNAEKLVLVNAAAAIYVAGKATNLPDAFALATASIASREALRKLLELGAATNR